MARKRHSTGTKASHKRKEIRDLLSHLDKRKQQLLSQFMRRQRKKNKRLVRTVRSVAAPEILKQWARNEQLIARKQVKERRIRQFTFYCRLLAIDTLYLKHMPKQAIRIQKGVSFRPPKEGILSKARKRDILEKLNEMETTLFKTKKALEKQVKKLQKNLPQTLPKAT